MARYYIVITKCSMETVSLLQCGEAAAGWRGSRGALGGAGWGRHVRRPGWALDSVISVFSRRRRELVH